MTYGCKGTYQGVSVVTMEGMEFPADTVWFGAVHVISRCVDLYLLE